MTAIAVAPPDAGVAATPQPDSTAHVAPAPPPVPTTVQPLPPLLPVPLPPSVPAATVKAGSKSPANHALSHPTPDKPSGGAASVKTERPETKSPTEESSIGEPHTPPAGAEEPPLRLVGIVSGNPTVAVLRRGAQRYVVKEKDQLEPDVCVVHIGVREIVLDDHGSRRIIQLKDGLSESPKGS